MKPDLDYPWQGAFREIAVAIAERSPTEQRFDELWAYLGAVVRFLVTNDPRRAKDDPAPEEPGGQPEDITRRVLCDPSRAVHVDPHTPESGCGVVR